MLNPVDPITWAWGMWGLMFLATCLWRREWTGVELGAVMFSTWAVSAWSIMWFRPEPAFYVTTFYDAAAGIGLALWMSMFGASRRGVWIVALFAVEMVVRLPAASAGFWNEYFCYATLCAIYGLQVAIGGWRGIMDTIADWSAAVRPRRRIPARRS